MKLIHLRYCLFVCDIVFYLPLDTQDNCQLSEGATTDEDGRSEASTASTRSSGRTFSLSSFPAVSRASQSIDTASDWSSELSDDSRLLSDSDLERLTFSPACTSGSASSDDMSLYRSDE